MLNREGMVEVGFLVGLAILPLSLKWVVLIWGLSPNSQLRILSQCLKIKMSLNPIELHGYSILFLLKMGLENSASASLSSWSGNAGGNEVVVVVKGGRERIIKKIKEKRN